MTAVAVDRSTGALLVDGRKVFPLVLSNGPPPGAKTPSGGDALAEVAAGGANFLRSGRPDWSLQSVDRQIAAARELLDAAEAHGLLCWLQLGSVPDFSDRAPAANEELLTSIVGELKGHPALGVWKGVDEPANPNRPSRVPAAGLVRAYHKTKALDPSHPLALIQAPLGTVAQLAPYRSACDITGADIYPVSYPPGKHAGGRSRNIDVVGSITQKMVRAAGGKPVWMTLQIAWSGVIPTSQHPGNVPRFPTLQQERFMAYQAIIHGARGFSFFGGHLTDVARPADAQSGWNWTFWELVLRPLLSELSSPGLTPALVAGNARRQVKASAKDVELVTREAGGYVYVIAVRRGSATSRVGFSGLPARRNGTPIRGGQVLFEYEQSPLPPPVDPDKQAFRSVAVANGRFRDWLGPHDARVYRFRR
ncbi:MAG TPA: hypothetical protein VFU30_00295 [Gaiellaceae bacterium]|nr:hypothetical protein [Gaiellaceae bacterium]